MDPAGTKFGRGKRILVECHHYDKTMIRTDIVLHYYDCRLSFVQVNLSIVE